MDDSEIEVEEGKQYEKEIDCVFGRKIALGFMAVNFKFKEIALKIVVKHSEKLLSPETINDNSFNITDFVRACTIAASGKPPIPESRNAPDLIAPLGSYKGLLA